MELYKKMKYYFIYELLNDGTHWGGAEKNAQELVSRLQNHIDAEIMKTSNFRLEDNAYYIFGNYGHLDQKIILEFTYNKKYSIFEHDHHYCPTRNPMDYSPDCKLTSRQIINPIFYRRAENVFCLSKGHKKIIDQNIKANTISLGITFFSDKRLQFIEKLNKNYKEKIPKAAIHNSDARHKNTLMAIAYCKSNNIDFDLIQSTPNEEKFLERIAPYSKYVFFPGAPETFSRTLIEAKMMNIKVVTEEKWIGAASEDLWQLNGKELVSYIKDIAMPNGEKIILDRLLDKK